MRWLRRTAPALVVSAILVCIDAALDRRPYFRASAINEPAVLEKVAKAWRDLAHGRPKVARSLFTRVLRGAEREPNSFEYVSSTKGIILADLFDKRDAAAQSEFNMVSQGEPKPDALVYQGRFNDAMRAYRNTWQDNSESYAPTPGPDPNIGVGAERAIKGDINGAIRAWSRPAVGRGPNSLQEIQTVLVGLGYARLGNWPRAERAWLIAAHARLFEPQMASISQGNVMALSMLLHYRKHFERGDHRFRWPVADDDLRE